MICGERFARLRSLTWYRLSLGILFAYAVKPCVFPNQRNQSNTFCIDCQLQKVLVQDIFFTISKKAVLFRNNLTAKDMSEFSLEQMLSKTAALYET